MLTRSSNDDNMSEASGSNVSGACSTSSSKNARLAQS